MRAKGEANSWLLVAAPKTRVPSLYIGGDNASRPSDGWPLDPMALGHLSNLPRDPHILNEVPKSWLRRILQIW